MADVATVNSIAALQTTPTGAGAVVYLSIAGREGNFVWRTGDFTTQTASDPHKGLYVASTVTAVTSGCWVREWDGVHGHPEWFGAIVDNPTADNLAPLNACFTLCRVTVLGAHDYYISNTLTFDKSNKAFIGAPCSPANRNVGVGVPSPLGNAGGSRVILAGANVVASTVFQFGKAVIPSSDNDTLTRNSIVRDISFCRLNTTTNKARNSLSSNAVDCVKGIICSGIAACQIENVNSFDSPVGWHCLGCTYSKWDDCAAWRSTPATTATNDFSVGFLVGGFTTNFGYAGSNASVYFNRCVSYDLNGGDVSVGFRLFGAIADSFLTQIEVGRCQVGIEIDGRDAAGNTIPLSTNGSQQDVHVINPVIDGTTQQGLQLRNLNPSFQVSIISPYIATAGASADFNILGGANKVEGHVSMIGGVLLSGGGTGLVATDGIGITVIGTLFRNYGVPISLTNCLACRIEPDLNNYAVPQPATNGIYLSNVHRSSIKPIIRGISGSPGFTNGVYLDGGDFNCIDPTMIDYGCFTSPSAARKVQYLGTDARGNAAFTAAGNLLVGVTG